jgi:metal-responsive CopG/Arc/MetJ family transcriptional regulator
MSTAKIAISLDRKILKTIDRLVAKKLFSSRSRAISEALEEKIVHMGRGRLARECAKLNAKTEQALADEGLSAEIKNWPKY